MSFLTELDMELARRRVRGSVRRRIMLEYADHLACDPESETRLGRPPALARTFAAELAADDARRVSRDTFVALVLAAVALLAGQLTVSAAGGPPGFNRGASVALSMPAILLMVLASQVALVSGSLAALRALRRRHARELPDAEIGLIHRRCRVGTLAGIGTSAGLLLYTANFTERLAGWWLAMQAALAVIALGALVRSLVQSRVCATTTPGVAGAAGSLASDLPPLAPLAARPWTTWALVSAAAFLAATALAAHAEHSLQEGLQRGGFEGIAVATGLAIPVLLTRRRRN